MTRTLELSRGHCWLILLALAIGLAWLATDPATCAAATEDPVTSGGDALRSGRKYPWYDRANDDLERVEIRTATVRPRGPTRMSFNWLQYLGWAAVAALLMGVAYALIYSLLNRENKVLVSGTSTAPEVSDADRVEELPFMARRVQGDLLEQARRYYQEGNYREAIIYLFSHELVQLDKRGVVRLARGKTNRQYVRETGAMPPLKPLLEQTMNAFERVFFGDKELDRQSFENCWNQLGQFDQALAEVTS